MKFKVEIEGSSSFGCADFRGELFTASLAVWDDFQSNRQLTSEFIKCCGHRVSPFRFRKIAAIICHDVIYFRKWVYKNKSTDVSNTFFRLVLISLHTRQSFLRWSLIVHFSLFNTNTAWFKSNFLLYSFSLLPLLSRLFKSLLYPSHPELYPSHPDKEVFPLHTTLEILPQAVPPHILYPYVAPCHLCLHTTVATPKRRLQSKWWKRNHFLGVFGRKLNAQRHHHQPYHNLIILLRLLLHIPQATWMNPNEAIPVQQQPPATTPNTTWMNPNEVIPHHHSWNPYAGAKKVPWPRSHHRRWS